MGLSQSVFANNHKSSIYIEPSIVEGWMYYVLPYIAGKISMIPFGIGSMDGSLLLLTHFDDIFITKGISIVILMRLLITIPQILIGSVMYCLIKTDSSQNNPDLEE